jgi:hypothetical protein
VKVHCTLTTISPDDIVRGLPPLQEIRELRRLFAVVEKFVERHGTSKARASFYKVSTAGTVWPSRRGICPWLCRGYALRFHGEKISGSGDSRGTSSEPRLDTIGHRKNRNRHSLQRNGRMKSILNGPRSTKPLRLDLRVRSLRQLGQRCFIRTWTPR